MLDWDEITMEIREFIKNYLDSGKSILAEKPSTRETSENSDKLLTNFERELIAILDEYVTPAVAQDGGYISLDSFEAKTKTVNVLLQGACSGCPSSTITLKNGIENLLKQMLPGKVNHVVAING